MNALTLTQPWATLMIARRLDTGIPSKRIESRSWPPLFKAEQIRGMYLGIHAGKGCPAAVRESISDGIKFREPYASALVACGYAPFDPWNRDYPERVMYYGGGMTPKPKLLPLGALIGVAVLYGIITGTRVLAHHAAGKIDALEIALGHYDESDEKRFGWVTSNTIELPASLPMRGYQKLWKIENDFTKLIDSYLKDHDV